MITRNQEKFVSFQRIAAKNMKQNFCSKVSNVKIERFCLFVNFFVLYDIDFN